MVNESDVHASVRYRRFAKHCSRYRPGTIRRYNDMSKAPVLNVRFAPARRAVIRLVSTAPTHTSDVDAAGLDPRIPYVGTVGGWHWRRRLKRWSPCAWLNCRACAGGARRHLRFEIHVLHEVDGTPTPRRVFASPTISRELARLAEEIEGKNADPLGIRLLLGIDERGRQQVHLLEPGEDLGIPSLSPPNPPAIRPLTFEKLGALYQLEHAQADPVSLPADFDARLSAYLDALEDAARPSSKARDEMHRVREMIDAILHVQGLKGAGNR